MAFDPNQFPLGDIWNALSSADKTKYQNLAFGNLRAYGVDQLSDLDTDAKQAAFAVYLKQIVDGVASADSLIVPEDVKIAFDPTLIDRPENDDRPASAREINELVRDGVITKEEARTRLGFTGDAPPAVEEELQRHTPSVGGITRGGLHASVDRDDLATKADLSNAEERLRASIAANTTDIDSNTAGIAANASAARANKSVLDALPDWVTGAALIPSDKFRLTISDTIARLSTYLDAIMAFFGTRWSTAHTTTYTFQTSDDITNLFSHWGDNSAYTNANTDGVITTGNATLAAGNAYVGGFDDPTFQENLIHVRIRRAAINTGLDYTVLGFRDPSSRLLYPILRISHGVLQGNHTGTRTNQQWQNLSGVNLVGNVETIQFQAGSTAELLVEFGRNAAGNIEFVIAARQIGGSNPTTWQANNWTETNHALPVTQLHGEIQLGNRFEAWNAPYTTHERQGQLENEHIDERALGYVNISQHDKDVDTYRGNLDVVGALTVNGQAPASGGGGGGGETGDGYVEWEQVYARAFSAGFANNQWSSTTWTIPDDGNDIFMIRIQTTGNSNTSTSKPITTVVVTATELRALPVALSTPRSGARISNVIIAEATYGTTSRFLDRVQAYLGRNSSNRLLYSADGGSTGVATIRVAKLKVTVPASSGGGGLSQAQVQAIANQAANAAVADRPTTNAMIQYVGAQGYQTATQVTNTANARARAEVNALNKNLRGTRVYSSNHTPSSDGRIVQTGWTIPSGSDVYVFEFDDGNGRTNEFFIPVSTLRGLNATPTSGLIWQAAGGALEKFGMRLNASSQPVGVVFYFARTSTNRLLISTHRATSSATLNITPFNIYRMGI